MKENRIKRILSAVLAVVLFATCFPVITFADNRFAITSGGEAVSGASVDKHEYLEVRAENLPMDTAAQWQIQIPGTDTWINIQGQTGETLKLSYALLGSLLEGRNAYVRCAAISGGVEVDHTDPLRVTITEKQEQAAPAPVTKEEPRETAPTQPPAETEPPQTPTEAPAEEPTETPAEEPTEAPAEEPTEAPAEEPTEAPAEEPTEAPAEEPTEAPTEAPAESPAPNTEETEESNPAAFAAKSQAEAPTEEISTEEAPTEEAPAEETSPEAESAGELPGAEPAAEEPGTGDTLELVSITIQYTYRDSQNAPVEGFDWPPYVANIPAGDDYKETVQIKTIPGYLARLEDTSDNVSLSDDKRTVIFNLENVTQSRTYTIVYEAIQVTYHVRRFLQNVNNDLYTEDTTFIDQVFMGYPGSLPDTAAIYRESDYPGFTALFYQPDTIAADGSTVFEVYYDRNYYLINFDLDGGYGVSPIYARYQTAYRVPTPTKPGYTFDKWELVSGATADRPVGYTTKTLSSTVPLTNQKYRAIWNNADTSYQVVYWLEDANSDKYLYHSSSEAIPAKSGDPVSAEDYKDDVDFKNLSEYVVYNETKTREEEAKQEFRNDEGKVIVQGDGSTILNVYYDRKEYNLKFYYAMTAETTDLENYPDGHQYIYVIGGSTWHFGSSADVTDKSNELNMLNWYMSNSTGMGQRGTITALPELTEDGLKKGYTMGTEAQTVSGTKYLYYYLMFSAKYGQDIEDLWPTDVFKAATRQNMDGQTWWSSNQTYVSAWNGEYNVRYSRFDNNGNQTIKGKYPKLDNRILWADDNGDPIDPSDMTVSYLCFWENGTNISWSVPELYYYRLWVPLIVQKDENGNVVYQETFDGETIEYNGIQYKLYDRYATCDNSSVGEQTAVSLEGFDDPPEAGGVPPVRTGVGGASGQDAETAKQILKEKYGYTDTMLATYKEWYIVDFYYTRNEPGRLKYFNFDAPMGNGEGAEVPFGKPLAVYGTYFTKEVMEKNYYPENLEDNAYEFAGWYTSPDGLPGSEMDWTGTMPDSDLTVYAKWVPKTYDVTFYLDYEKYKSGTPVHYKVEDTPHGETMLNPPDVPDYGDADYSFIRWVYEDEAGNKHSFEPTEMPVRQDLKLYAEWRAREVGEYTVYFAKGEELADGTFAPSRDDAGNLIYLTKQPQTGYAMVGTTKTIQAKTVAQLDNIPAGSAGQLWLPQTGSHSILMQSDKEKNVFTFLYITKTAANYKVLYLDEETGQPVHEETTGTTTNAEETLRFQYVEGYIPDAIHKRLVMSADDEQNVLIFYYTKDDPGENQEENGPYQINHWLQNVDGKTFTNTESETGKAPIKSTVTATPKSFPGFTFTNGVTLDGVAYTSQLSGIVRSGANTGTDKALELNLYYLRDRAEYTVYYKNQDDANDPNMLPSKTESGFVGEVVEETAPEIPGYELISDEIQTLTVSSTSRLNQITFWYKEKDRTVYYRMLCTDPYAQDYGKLTKSEDMGTQISGSQAIAMSGFYFDGWYQENTATGELELVCSNAAFNPDDEGCIRADVYEYTFYARFKPITLKLTHQNFRYENRSAVYEILRYSDGTPVATVSISGDNTVILERISTGSYIIREIGPDWTWTYASTAEKSFEVVAGENEVILPHTPQDVDWRNAENWH